MRVIHYSALFPDRSLTTTLGPSFKGVSWTNFSSKQTGTETRDVPCGPEIGALLIYRWRKKNIVRLFILRWLCLLGCTLETVFKLLLNKKISRSYQLNQPEQWNLWVQSNQQGQLAKCQSHKSVVFNWTRVTETQGYFVCEV